MVSILRCPLLLHSPPPCRVTTTTTEISRCNIRFPPKQTSIFSFSSLKLAAVSSSHITGRFYRRSTIPVNAASYGETTETEEVEEVGKDDENKDSENEMIVEEDIASFDNKDSEDEVIVEEDVASIDSEDKTTLVVPQMLQAYKEALKNDDRSKVSEVESFLLSIKDEKESYAKKISTLSKEISVEKDRVLRIGADFDNFRKRTEKQRLSLMSNAQGEIVESLLPVLDNFERAKVQIKVETEAEEKISNSYQSIYKQFVELLNSLGVEAVETVGTTFDPMLHEAIMQEDSSEFKENIILQEFRKGFKLGDRLLRPSMVKVSSGPGPVKFDETHGDEIPATESIEEDDGGEAE